jgi:hypothetical protein
LGRAQEAEQILDEVLRLDRNHAGAANLLQHRGMVARN